jgi:hypothetical protein
MHVMALEGALRPVRSRPHVVGVAQRVLEHLEPLGRGGNGKPRPSDSSWFQAAPMPSSARPPDSTSSVVAAFTHSGAWR